MRIKKKDIDRVIEILQKLKKESFDKDENSEIEIIGNKIIKVENDLLKNWYVVWDRNIAHNMELLNKYYGGVGSLSYIKGAVFSNIVDNNGDNSLLYFNSERYFLQTNESKLTTKITSEQFIKIAKLKVYGY